MGLGVLQKATLGGAKLESHRSSAQSRYVGILGGHCLLCPCQPRVGEDTLFIRSLIQPGPYLKPW